MALKFLGLKKGKKFWFKRNQDAPGYAYGDNRIMENDQQVRRETVRRTWNI
jgi:hypothetical protein